MQDFTGNSLTHCSNETETRQLAETFAASLRQQGAFEQGTLISLEGDLGAGKSFFARAFIHHFLPDVRVKSPTYTLMERYDTPYGPIFHWDLYRLCDPEELAYIGGREVFSPPGLHLIEWAEKGDGWLPPVHWRVCLETPCENERNILIEKLA